MQDAVKHQAQNTLDGHSWCFTECPQRQLGSRGKRATDPFMFHGWHVHAPVPQDKAGISQARFGADLGALPKPKLIATVGKQLADQRKPRLILRQLSVSIFFYFDYLMVRAPNNQNVGCVSAHSSLVVVFENKWLLLPVVCAPGGHQNPERPEFTLRFSVA
jgi:hypothetical protein